MEPEYRHTFRPGRFVLHQIRPAEGWWRFELALNPQSAGEMFPATEPLLVFEGVARPWLITQFYSQQVTSTVRAELLLLPLRYFTSPSQLLILSKLSSSLRGIWLHFLTSETHLQTSRRRTKGSSVQSSQVLNLIFLLVFYWITYLLPQLLPINMIRQCVFQAFASIYSLQQADIRAERANRLAVNRGTHRRDAGFVVFVCTMFTVTEWKNIWVCHSG